MSTCLHGKRLPREPFPALTWVGVTASAAVTRHQEFSSVRCRSLAGTQHPQPQPLLPLKKQEIRRIQISQLQELLLPPNRLMPLPQPHPQSLSQPQPQPLLRPKPLPLKRDRSRMIQIQLLQPPHPLLFCAFAHPQESLQPQFVAVKSLM